MTSPCWDTVPHLWVPFLGFAIANVLPPESIHRYEWGQCTNPTPQSTGNDQTLFCDCYSCHNLPFIINYYYYYENFQLHAGNRFETKKNGIIFHVF